MNQMVFLLFSFTITSKRLEYNRVELFDSFLLVRFLEERQRCANNLIVFSKITTNTAR